MKTKKFLSLLLAILLCFSCFSIISFAETTDSEHITTVPEGYVGVYDIEDLYCIRNDMTANYILMNNIDLSEATAEGGDWNYGGRGWNPIGSNDVYGGTEFEGIFDGNNYTISGLNIDIKSFPSGRSSQTYVGLFGAVSGTIKNLSVDGQISTLRTSKYTHYGTNPYYYFGGICAYLSAKGTIENCKNNVKMNIYAPHGTGYGTSYLVHTYVGGITGDNMGTIKNCVNNADIYLTVKSSYSASGTCSGIAISGKAYNCFNTGNISANSLGTDTTDYNYYCSASAYGIGGTAENCYNIGNIEGSAIGNNSSFTCFGIGPTAKYCYNIGVNSGKLAYTSTKCYFLENTALESTGSTVLSDTQMKLQSMYSGWDFDTVWTMEGREDYPYPELRYVPLIFPDELNHEHEYSSEITTPATHLTEGVETFTCACGDTYTEAIAKTTEHTYSTIVTEPTCTDRGFTLYFCACNDFYMADYVEANGHSHTTEIITPATHLTEGLMKFTCACGDTYTAAIAKTTEHTYNAVVTAPTCTEKGYTTYTCECGDTYIADYVQENGHSYTSEITTPATHLAEGLMTFTCTCGDTYTEAMAKTTEHTYTFVVTAPTCAERGFTTYTCACGDSYIADYVDVIEHKDANSDKCCDYCNDFLVTEKDEKDCSHMCHSSGIWGIIWKILSLFYKLFGVSPVCECGAAHY